MSLRVFALVASEFMRGSLLTSIASELEVREGQAEQAIAISGASSVLTSLFISSIAGSLDQKVVAAGAGRCEASRSVLVPGSNFLKQPGFSLGLWWYFERLVSSWKRVSLKRKILVRHRTLIVAANRKLTSRVCW
jgi:hypothetical protein